MVGAAPARSLPATPPARRGRTSARLRFEHLGTRLVRVPYQVLGPTGAPATVVLGGISASRHIAPAPFDARPGWWPGVVGAGEALDPASRRLVGMDYLGGADEGPVRPDSAGGRSASPAGSLLRPVTTRDQARALAAVLDHLDIRAASIAGASYGGMVALAFAELFPARVSRLVVLGAAHRPHPMATALRSLQRAAAALGARSGRAADGVALARALAMTTYRSPQEFEGRFDHAPLEIGGAASGAQGAHAPARFPVQSYLEACGAEFARRFDLDRFLALSESIDLHRSDPEAVPQGALLVSFDTDAIAPPWLVDELALGSGGAARHVTLPSLYGHDAFLKEAARVSSLLQSVLRTPEVVR